MSSSPTTTTAAAKEREVAAARSTKLTSLFDRLAAADARVRQRGSISVDDADTDNTANIAQAGAGPSTKARDGQHAQHRHAPSAHASRATASPVNGGRPAGAPLVLRNGRAVVLSAGSRRLPPAFQEQTQMMRSVEAATDNMQETLQQLHRDLAVHGRSRTTNGNNNNNPHSSSKGSTYNHNAASMSGSVNGLQRHPSASMDDAGSGGAYFGASTLTAAAQRRMAEAEAKMEKLRIQRARAAAADEGASDDQSVEDYGADLEIPPLTGESRLEDEVAAISAHFAKAKVSALAMAEVEELAPTTSAAPWWSSALRLRDMKAAAARLDYHAHAALGWSYRAREQLLLQVAHLNTVSGTTRDQLLQQQQHWHEFQARLRDGQQAVAQMQTEIAQWQAQAQEEANRRADLQAELLTHARLTDVVDAAETNHLKAELALLLGEREWPSRTLHRDAQTVLEWLRSVSTPLD